MRIAIHRIVNGQDGSDCDECVTPNLRLDSNGKLTFLRFELVSNEVNYQLEIT